MAAALIAVVEEMQRGSNEPRIVTTRLLVKGLVLAGAVGFFAVPANARTARRIFEPTDLELEDPGIAELDVQLGLVRGRDPYRLSVPDFELDLGVSRRVELEIDGAVGIEGPENGDFAFSRMVPDNLWTAVKVGVLDLRDAVSGNTWAVGFQLGPKLPTARGSSGLGGEALLLGAFRAGPTLIALSAGGLIDPRTDEGPHRPIGFEGGIDFGRQVDSDGRWTLTAEVGGVRFTSKDAHQLTVTAGVAWAPGDLIEFSVVGLAGALEGSDRYGILVGVSPKVRLWR